MHVRARFWLQTLDSACSHSSSLFEHPESHTKKPLMHPQEQHGWIMVVFDRSRCCKLVYKRMLNGKKMKHFAIETLLKRYLRFLIKGVDWHASIFIFRAFVRIEEFESLFSIWCRRERERKKKWSNSANIPSNNGECASLVDIFSFLMFLSGRRKTQVCHAALLGLQMWLLIPLCRINTSWLWNPRTTKAPTLCVCFGIHLHLSCQKHQFNGFTRCRSDANHAATSSVDYLFFCCCFF